MNLSKLGLSIVLATTLSAVTALGCSAETTSDEPVAAESEGAQTDLFRTLDPLLHDAVTARRFPGAVVHAGALFDLANEADDQTITRAYGSLAYDARPVNEDTMYDLASVTKALGTTVAVMREVDRGRLALTSDVRALLPDLAPAFAGITVKRLLSHTSCLVDGPPPGSLATREGRGADASNVVAFMNLHAGRVFQAGKCAPTYSDLNLVLAAALVQKSSGKRLDAYLAEEVFGPLGMSRTRFNPTGETNIAPTETYPTGDRAGRKGSIVGEVHDETSFFFGGVGGNAGMFSTAGDLGRLVRALLRDTLVRRETRDAFFSSQGVRDQLGSERALGFEVRPSHCGKGFGPRTVGHTGFAGTSFCIDPDSSAYTIVLTNRVYPSRNGRSIHPDRVALSGALLDKVSPCVLRPTWTVCGHTAQGDYSGRPGVLYSCPRGAATVCPRGCTSAPAGKPDVCAP
ncbi:MAG: beta-lactamase family protein [Myxococcales bacterium]|nr:beta-lactamase family protein [Myxococcales bacterium]